MYCNINLSKIIRNEMVCHGGGIMLNEVNGGASGRKCSLASPTLG